MIESVDVLSDALAALRTGRPQASRKLMKSPWGIHFPPVAGAGFHIVLRGSGWLITTEGAPTRLGRGDVMLLHRGQEHAVADRPDISLDQIRRQRYGALTVFDEDDIRVEDDYATSLLCGAYHLDQTQSHPLFKALPSVIHLPARVDRHPVLRSAIDLLSYELENKNPGRSAIVANLIDIMLLYILRSWFDDQIEKGNPTGWSAAFQDSGIVAALSAIHAFPDQQWTVHQLGMKAGMSRAVFAKKFAALVGEPPLTYLTRWRLQHAARLLRQPELTLTEIARRSGYASQFAFSKAFKRQYDAAPGQYRSLVRLTNSRINP